MIHRSSPSSCLCALVVMPFSSGSETLALGGLGGSLSARIFVSLCLGGELLFAS